MISLPKQGLLARSSSIMCLTKINTPDILYIAEVHGSRQMSDSIQLLVVSLIQVFDLFKIVVAIRSAIDKRDTLAFPLRVDVCGEPSFKTVQCVREPFVEW